MEAVQVYLSGEKLKVETVAGHPGAPRGLHSVLSFLNHVL